MNKKLIPIVIAALCSILAFSSCHLARNVKIKDIITVLTFVNNCLEGVKQSSNTVSATVDASYKNLGIYLRNGELNTTTITNMEDNLAIMQEESDTLRLWLDATESNANVLFELLETRADENKTKKLRSIMLDDIEEKRDEFSDKMETARNVLKQIDKSIQKYNDILGYIQVGIGLDEVDKYIGDIDNAIREGKQLNSQIQEAIEESKAIVNTIQSQSNGGMELKG